MFRGYLTALITPFRNGEVDEDAYRDFVDLADRRRRRGAGALRNHG